MLPKYDTRTFPRAAAMYVDGAGRRYLNFSSEEARDALQQDDELSIERGDVCFHYYVPLRNPAELLEPGDVVRLAHTKYPNGLAATREEAAYESLARAHLARFVVKAENESEVVARLVTNLKTMFKPLAPMPLVEFSVVSAASLSYSDARGEFGEWEHPPDEDVPEGKKTMGSKNNGVCRLRMTQSHRSWSSMSSFYELDLLMSVPSIQQTIATWRGNELAERMSESRPAFAAAAQAAAAKPFGGLRPEPPLPRPSTARREPAVETAEDVMSLPFQPKMPKTGPASKRGRATYA